jgi:protein involved in polysaccharide export with SLBB domain
MLFIGLPVFSQVNQNRTAANSQLQNVLQASFDNSSAAQNVILARSSVDYRVTQGDIYTLVYAAGANQITYVINVDASYRIRVSNLGIVNGAGKTFMQLRNEIETIVTNNFPMSGVQLVLTQPATFRVIVKGEVLAAGEIYAWALSRLSSLVMMSEVNSNSQIQNQDQVQSQNQVQNQGSNQIQSQGQTWSQIQANNSSNLLTNFTSLRDITVKSLNGQTTTYDLFRAQRLGDLSQDPYLRPGDEITFNRVKRSVMITGEIERPGVYHLLDGENVKELIEFYGSGFTPEADRTRLELTRLVNSNDVSGDKIYITENDLAENYALENYDIINIPKITQLQPVLFIEGAVRNTSTAGAENLTASNRLTVRFNSGETYASLIRRIEDLFYEVSDTQNSYIVRDEERMPINLNMALYDANYRDDLLVQENDVLVIPFRQYFVSVAGAVINPGRYPYIPDRDWEYYIGLAGGFIPDRNTNNSITIVDFNGKRMNKTDIITPEATITANTNHFLFFFNQYAPLITTALTVISTIFTILTYANNSANNSSNTPTP